MFFYAIICLEFYIHESDGRSFYDKKVFGSTVNGSGGGNR